MLWLWVPVPFSVSFKGACSLCLCLYDLCIAGFQLVLQACLALFDLYNSYI
jgi:hypothetical protein